MTLHLMTFTQISYNSLDVHEYSYGSCCSVPPSRLSLDLHSTGKNSTCSLVRSEKCFSSILRAASRILEVISHTHTTMSSDITHTHTPPCLVISHTHTPPCLVISHTHTPPCLVISHTHTHRVYSFLITEQLL